MHHESNISLLEILEDRYGDKSTVIASQIPPENWYDLFRNSTIADACLDRIIHNAHKLNMEGGLLYHFEQVYKRSNSPEIILVHRNIS